jgi:hypothetical protein
MIFQRGSIQFVSAQLCFIPYGDFTVSCIRSYVQEKLSLPFPVYTTIANPPGAGHVTIVTNIEQCWRLVLSTVQLQRVRKPRELFYMSQFAI